MSSLGLVHTCKHVYTPCTWNTHTHTYTQRSLMVYKNNIDLTMKLQFEQGFVAQHSSLLP